MIRKTTDLKYKIESKNFYTHHIHLLSKWCSCSYQWRASEWLPCWTSWPPSDSRANWDWSCRFELRPLTGLSCVHQGEDGKSGTPGRDGKPGKEVCRSAGQYDTWIKNVQSRPSVICSSIRLHYSKSKSKKCAHTKSYALNFNSTGYKEDLSLTSCCLKSVKNKPVDRFGLGWIVSHWQI